MPTPVLPEIAKDQKDWTEKSSQKSMWDLYKGYPIMKEKAKIPIGLEAADRERRATSSPEWRMPLRDSILSTLRAETMDQLFEKACKTTDETIVEVLREKLYDHSELISKRTDSHDSVVLSKSEKHSVDYSSYFNEMRLRVLTDDSEKEHIPSWTLR